MGAFFWPLPIKKVVLSGGTFQNKYILEDEVENAYEKSPGARNATDNEIIKVDERVNIAWLVFTGELLRIFPDPVDSLLPWYNYNQIQGRINTADSLFLENVALLYLQDVRASVKSSNWNNPDQIIKAISAYQQKKGLSSAMPSAFKIKLEIFLNNTGLFEHLAYIYGVLGLLMLAIHFIRLFLPHFKLGILPVVLISLMYLAFITHTAGLAARWYVSGHAPWSNGFEVLIYLAWTTILAGLVLSVRSEFTMAVTPILSFLILQIAHLSWMDPQITNLVPVLKSYWLVIHVATITASYGFLGMGALLAYVNLLLMVFLTQHNRESVHLTILKQTNIIGMSLIIGLYLLAVGSFLGGVWANESWGRYWGWDPKETWAMVTILVYAFIVHMDKIPGFRGPFAVSFAPAG